MRARQEQPAPPKPGGRERQKLRTRRALMEAAAELIRAGGNPTVAEVAEAADISRATAYRYYPTQGLLLAEVALFAAGGPLFPEEGLDPGTPVPDRVALLVRRVAEWAYDNESSLRTVLRLSLDPATGVTRPGHRVGWIDEALRPVRDQIPDAVYDRLSASLALLLGIDPIVVMTDLVGRSREDALDALEWTARTLVEGALAENGCRGRRPSARETGR